MSALPIIVTNAGRAAIVNAQNNGTNPLLIHRAGISATAIAATPATTAIAGEIKRIATISGDIADADTIHLVVRDESTDIYTLRTFGLYLEDGTLFAVYSQPDPIMEKSAQSMLMLAAYIRFVDIDAADLVFGDTNFLMPPATTEMQGVIELATPAETEAGADDRRAVTPHTMKSAVTSWLNTRFGAGAPSAFVKTLLTAASAAAMRISLGLGSAATRNEGAGGGLDSDLLDGKEGAWYADILARLGYTPWGPNNDGAGSGMDADTVDGRQASEFALLTGAAFTGAISATTGGFAGTVTVGGGTKGRVAVKEGDANNTGFVEFLTAAGARKGYVGFVGVENAINYVAEGGVFHKFNSNIQMTSVENIIFSNNFGSLSSAEPTKFLNNADWIWQNTNGTVRLTLKGTGGLDVPAGAGYSIGGSAVAERSSDGTSIFSFCGTTYWRLMDSTKLVNMLIVNNGTGDLSARGAGTFGGTLTARGIITGGSGGPNGSIRFDRSDGATGLAVIDWVTAGNVLRYNNANGGIHSWRVNDVEMMQLGATGNLLVAGAASFGGNIDIAAGSGLRIAGRVVATDAANGTWLYGGTAGFTFRNAANSATITTLDNVGNLSVVGAITRGGHKVWDAGNHGPGTGLHADLLDTFHASDFARVVSSSYTSTGGHRIWSDGYKECWGVITAAGDASTFVTYPITFTQWSRAYCTGGNPTYAQQDNGPFVTSSSTNGCAIWSSIDIATTTSWHAFGY